MPVQWPQKAACRRWTSAVHLSTPTPVTADKEFRALLQVKPTLDVSHALSRLGLDVQELNNVLGFASKNPVGPKVTLEALLTKRSPSHKVPLSFNMLMEYCKLSDSSIEAGQQRDQGFGSGLAHANTSANGFVQQALVMYDHRSAPTAGGGLSPGTSQPIAKPREFHSVHRLIQSTLHSSPLHSMLAVPIAAHALCEMHHACLIAHPFMPLAGETEVESKLSTASPIGQASAADTGNHPAHSTRSVTSIQYGQQTS